MKIGSHWLLAFLLPLTLSGAGADDFDPKGGWGVDAVLSRHLKGSEIPAYLELLKSGGVRVLRERGVGIRLPDGTYINDVRARYLQLKQAGFTITAFAGLPTKKKPADPANVLLEDLREVYAQGRILGGDFSGLVDAWEMVGEPDIGFCTDLPDRVAAYQKALYLGIKAGAAEAKVQSGKDKGQGIGHSALSPTPSATNVPLVLMGALGMPPGPWLERAAANGLLDYTDAYNFHFYGHAKDMTGVIEAHREAIRRLSDESYGLSDSNTNSQQRITNNQRHAAMPLWITEAGIEAVDNKDWLNAERRQMQADFTVSTAKQALGAEDVAVFMPFILVHDKDPYAMTLSPWKTFPAWDAYAKFTRENPWPKRALSREQGARSPIVMQWLPDNRTTVPHKVSGTYRFHDGQPIKGELRIYNFSEREVTGRLELAQLNNAVALLGAKGEGQRADGGHQTSDVSIPAMGVMSIPLEFAATAVGYFRETFEVSFVEENSRVSGFRSQVSRASFGLEAWAKPADFTEEPLALRALPDGVIRFPQIEPCVPGEQAGPWTTMNGLRAELAKAEGGRRLGADGEAKLKAEESEIIQVSGLRSQVSVARFWIEQPNTDPLAPTMAVAAVNGLPSTGFLRLQLDKPMTKERKVLAVLVDDRGQRYSIWENFGADYYGSRSDIWLNLEDFHADFWGPMSADYHFKSERIREVHLRFYLTNPNDPVRVGLSLLRAK